VSGSVTNQLAYNITEKCGLKSFTVQALEVLSGDPLWFTPALLTNLRIEKSQMKVQNTLACHKKYNCKNVLV
jgi:hypothetical protein